MAEARYTEQLNRLHEHMATVVAQATADAANPNLVPGQPQPAPMIDMNLIAAIERQITVVIGRLHDVGREIDPAEHLNKLRECYILTPGERQAAPPLPVGEAHERP